MPRFNLHAHSDFGYGYGYGLRPLPRFNLHAHSNFGYGLRPYNYQASNGTTLILLGVLLGSPFLVGLGYLEYATAPVVYYSIAATSTASATAFSLATVGVGALILYASIGLTYLYSGARECYLMNTNPLDLIKSRIFNKNPLSFNSVVNSIAAVVWSPFLLLGGLAGMAVKAAVKPTLKNTLRPEQIDARVEQLLSSLDNQTSQLKVDSSKFYNADIKPLEFDASTLQAACLSASTSGTFVIDTDSLASQAGKIYPPLFETRPVIDLSHLNTQAPITRQLTSAGLADNIESTSPVL